MRSWLLLVGIFAACGGTVVVDGPPEGGDGSGGDGGEGASGPGPGGPGPGGPGPGTTGPGQGPGPGPSTSVSTGPGLDCELGADGCVGCGELITFSSCVPEQLCPRSAAIFEKLLQCVCSNCPMECATVCNAGGDTPPECQSCAQAFCMGEISVCVNDISN